MCMGSTIFAVERKTVIQNHPHEYGEYVFKIIVLLNLIESPPCVWGVLALMYSRMSSSGITPMCMGSTSYHKSMMR